MNKSKTKNVRTPKVTEPVPVQLTAVEADEERFARSTRASEAIRKILKEENCIIMVPTLNISTGRVVPQIQVVAQQLTPSPK